MANFQMTLTAVGSALLAKGIAGKTLNFTGIALGDGTYSGNLIDATALQREVIRLDIQRMTRRDNIVTLRAKLEEDAVPGGFTWREIGVYAQDPDTQGDVLYMYGYAGDETDTVPKENAPTKIGKIINVNVIVSSTESVTAVLVPEDLEAHNADPNANPAAFEAHNADAGANSAAFAAHNADPEAHTGIKADLLAHIGDTANPHKVTAGQVGAVDLSTFYTHEHDPNAHEEAHAALYQQLADHEARIRRLEDAMYNDITGNPHSYLFDTLEGIRIVSGVWNKAKSRLEC